MYFHNEYSLKTWRSAFEIYEAVTTTIEGSKLQQLPLDSVQEKDGSFAFDGDVATQLENPLVFIVTGIQVPENFKAF